MKSDHALDTEVAIVGSGFSGLGAAIRLKREGIPFVILEKAADLGGTWRDNTYPGIAVDITSFTYSYSFEQNPDWSRVFAPGDELKAYADRCADRYQLRRHIRFNKQVHRAIFDSEQNVWTLHFVDRSSLRARYLVNACGVLTQPKRPDIAGLDSFRGKTMHTARWDHGYDLRDMRVAVIGTGATSVQLVPAIAPIVQQLHVYQRTPIWILPKPDRVVPEALKRLFRVVPGAQSAVRMTTTTITELFMVVGVVYNRQTPWLIQRFERMSRKHLAAQVRDPDIRAKLTPSYGLFCKRPSVSNTYYPSFERANVELVTDRIERVTERGIVTADGREREIDALVLATGFLVMERGNMPAFETVGRDDVELGDFWETNRYQAYEGTSVPGFPNHFMMVGPYSVTGASWFSMVEAQSEHLMRCLTEARRRGATRVEVTEAAHQRYFDMVKRRMPNTVFLNQNCSQSNSYYFDQRGDAPFFRPSGGLELWWRSRNFALDDYRYQ